MSPGVAVWHLGARPAFTFVPFLPEARYGDRTFGMWCRAPGYVLKYPSEELGLCKYQMRLVFPETVYPKTRCCGDYKAWWWRVRVGQMFFQLCICHPCSWLAMGCRDSLPCTRVFGRNSGVLADSQQADRQADGTRV